MDYIPGKQLSAGVILAKRYLIQDVIGIGGMGAVYRARDLHFQNAIKLVAVKEMINRATDLQSRNLIVENFEREANILVTLSHISVPKIFDYFTEESRSYLVLEYIQGKDLEKILQESQDFLPLERIYHWAIELCDVLEYLHTHKPEPIVFRDLKPSNIMINPHDHVILIDFGIAKNFGLGKKGTMIGTEGYAPPEQYRGEATPVADIYAFGATLHHILTRCDPRLEPPFTFLERSIIKANPSVPEALEKVIYKMVQYSPEDRFQSICEVREALLNCAPGGIRLRPLLFSAASKREESIPSRLVWKYQTGDEIRGSAFAHNQIVYFGSYDSHVYALQADNGHLLWKFKTENGVVGQPLLYDNVIYVGSEDRRLFAISNRTGRLLWAYETGGAIRSSPRIAEGHVFIGSDDGNLYAINLMSSRVVWKMEASGAIRSSPNIYENHLLFGCESGEFYCVDFKGQVRWRFKSKRPISCSPIADQGVVFFTSLDGFVYALDIRTGWQVWRFRMEKGSISSPCCFQSFLAFGSADGFIYCLDRLNGKEVWKYQTGCQVSGSPVFYDNQILCGAADGSLYSINSIDGQLKWKFETQGVITGTPVIHQNRIYIGSLDKNFYSIQASHS